MKRKKRERMLSEMTQEAEEKRKADLLIEKDLEVSSAMEPEKYGLPDDPQEKRPKKKAKKKNKGNSENVSEVRNETMPNTSNGMIHDINESVTHKASVVESSKKKIKKKKISE